MNNRSTAHDLPYWLWGAVLLCCACLHALPPDDLRRRDSPPVRAAASGFTVVAPQVGQVRVIPLASAVLVSPCAGPDLPLSGAEHALSGL